MNPFSNTKLFSVKELFPVLVNGKGNNNLLSDGDSIPYLGAKKDENGVMRYCANDSALTMEGNCICFICNGAGSVGYTLYMDRPFIATSDIVAGYNDNLNPYIAMYLISLFDLERPRFSYGRKWKKTLKDTTIPLPQTEDGNVDWAAIDLYIKNSILPILPSRAKTIWNLGVDKAPITQISLKLSDRDWKWFRFGDLIERPYKAKAYSAQDLTFVKPDSPNSIRYVTRTDENNGVKGFVENENFSDFEEGNAIIIGDTTSTIYYQDSPFICGDHIVVIRFPQLNKYNGLFLVTLLNQERFRYCYGKSYKKDSISNTMIKLPFDQNGNPDWVYMEDYIKSLPFSSYL